MIEGSVLRLRESYRPSVELNLHPTGPVDGQSTGPAQVSIDGLPAGVYQLTVELGAWYRSPDVLGEVEVRVEPGSRTAIALKLEPPPTPEPVSFKGSLTLPREWTIGDFELVAQHMDRNSRLGQQRFVLHRSQMVLVDERRGLYDWAFPEGIPSGVYSLVLEAANYGLVLGVSPSGVTQAHMVVPPPGRVSLVPVDASTGQELRVEEIHWKPVSSEPNFHDRFASLRPADEGGTFELLAPAGEILVQSPTGQPGLIDLKLTVRPGDNRFELPVHFGKGFVVVAKHGEEIVPWSSGWRVRPSPADGEQARVEQGDHPVGRRFTCSRPGVYRFRMPNLERYREVPEQFVLVKEGEYTELVIELEPNL